MKDFYTLGDMRREIFRALDEYSCNSEEKELFSGGTGDIDKRFVSALNAAVRLVYLSVSRGTFKKNVSLFMPRVLMELCDFSVSGKEPSKRVLLPAQSESASFEFCGSGTACVYAGNDAVCEIKLCSDFGVSESKRFLLPEKATAIEFSADGYLKIKKLRSYNADGALKYCGEEFLPDGKSIFCDFGEAAEIRSVTGMKYGREISVPADIFSFEDGILSCPEKYAGDYTVEYFRYPDRIKETDPLDTKIPLPYGACTAAVYAAAAELCAREDGELYTRLTYKYREILANLYPSENLTRKNSFFAGGIFGRRKKAPAFRG